VRAFDRVAAREIGDRARDLRDAVIGARGEREARQRLREQSLRGGRRHAMARDA
jgi:hypothetical protein